MTQAANSIQSASDQQQTAPIVIIGNGPAGLRACRDLRKQLPQQDIVLYGDEPHEPYNRIRLSSWLAREINWHALFESPQQEDEHLQLRYGFCIREIDRNAKQVIDHKGHCQPYSRLILATGSRPFVPDIPGKDLDGVYTFRSINDTLQLMARQASSHRTVILGGGLLGLEAARGMQRLNTQVTVVELSDRLMGQQLDAGGAEFLKNQVQALGIQVLLNSAVRVIRGESRVSAVELQNGHVIYCDTVVIAAGIRPNLDLARAAKLPCTRGIRVNNQMQTADADIYAVGECAEHNDEIYGLVGPALEQASVAAASISGQSGDYLGSLAASRLKVLDNPVFSIGPVGENQYAYYGRSLIYRNPEKGIYRKLLVHANRLVGAIAIGECAETRRLQSAVKQQQLLWPWQRLQFAQTGELWPNQAADDVAAWPAEAVVCQCTETTRGQIDSAIAKGHCRLVQIREATGASSVCGSCQPLVEELLGQEQAEPVRFAKAMAVIGFFAAFLGLAQLFAPAIPYADSVQVSWRWDQLWRDELWKQISGFSILGVFALGLLVSLRKRLNKLSQWGRFELWRLFHLATGLLVILVLLAHTGFRLGHGLNFYLMLSFSLLLLLGGLNTLAQAFQHKLDRAQVQRLRRQSLWLHILLFWPVPVLLGWHVFKFYWY